MKDDGLAIVLQLLKVLILALWTLSQRWNSDLVYIPRNLTSGSPSERETIRHSTVIVTAACVTKQGAWAAQRGAFWASPLRDRKAGISAQVSLAAFWRIRLFERNKKKAIRGMQKRIKGELNKAGVLGF